MVSSTKSKNARFQRWMEFEVDHLKKRWRELFRGEIRLKKDVDVTAEDMGKYHLILWGDPQSNSVIARVASKLPVSWRGASVVVGARTYGAGQHVPVCVYPNPLPGMGGRYVVLNSGPTFREDHDRTNSLQNPKLPDWAVLDITQDPNGSRAGAVVQAGFFDEQWQLQSVGQGQDQ